MLEFPAMLNLSFLLRCNKRLLVHALRNRFRVPSATGLTEQLAVTNAILKAPAGCVVECGTYLGGSAVNLSYACEMTQREFFVFDSFEGLPEPLADDEKHCVLQSSEIHRYSKGAWKGTLETVRNNLARYGRTAHLVKGYFEETLPAFNKPIAVAFCDVDLLASLDTCIRYLWPRLVDGGYFFTHEADHLSIAKLFHDDCWWQKYLGCLAPGLIGAGSGLGLSPKADGSFGSCIGYIVKNPVISAISNETGLDRALASHG